MKIKRKDLNMIIKECLNENKQSHVLAEAVKTGGGFDDYAKIENCDFSKFDDRILAIIFSTPHFLLLSEEEKAAFADVAAKNPQTVSSFERLAPPQRKALDLLVSVGMTARFGVLSAGICQMITDLSEDIREFLEGIGFFGPEEEIQPQVKQSGLELKGFISPVSLATYVAASDYYKDIKAKAQRSWTTNPISDFEIILFPNFHEQLGDKGIDDAVSAYADDVDILKEKIEKLENTRIKSQEQVMQILFDKTGGFHISNVGEKIVNDIKDSSPDLKAALEKELDVLTGSDLSHEMIKIININKQKFDAKYDPTWNLLTIPL